MAGANMFKSMDTFDGLSAPLREVARDFGLPIVLACARHGITNPRHIAELVKEIWLGARQGGQRSDAVQSMDWLLLQSGASTTGRQLIRFLAENNVAVVKAEPTRAMIDASLNAVSGFNVRCTKDEKHIRRLRAALRAGMAEQMK